MGFVEMGASAPVSEAEIASNTTTSRLAALPEELLSNISIKLGSDDVFSLRLTCRDIEAKVSLVARTTTRASAGDHVTNILADFP